MDDWKNKKLAIGIMTTREDVHTSFFSSFVAMEKPSEYIMMFPTFDWKNFPGDIANARNSLVEQAVGKDAEFLLFLDTDQIYPPDTIKKLMAHDVDICGAGIHRGWPPYDKLMFRGTHPNYYSVPDEEKYSGRLVAVDATGTGCLLIKTDVFKKIEKPFFDIVDLYDPVKKKDVKIGEDMYFCAKAREKNIDIFVDTSVEVGHLKTMNIGAWLYHTYRVLSIKSKE